MKNIRIGNDLVILWHFFYKDEHGQKQDYSLDGKQIGIILRDHRGVEVKPPFEREGNTVKIVFYGKDQHCVGNYSLTLQENAGAKGMVTIDRINPFSLVSFQNSIVKDSGNGRCDSFEINTLELESEMESSIGDVKTHPYLSLERLRKYLYRVTFDTLPENDGGNTFIPSGCSSYVRDGKLYRNLDFKYDNAASFIVRTKDFVGMSFITGLNDGEMDDGLIAQLPYRVVDGINNHGIMVSTHVLFNDWSWTGVGEKSVSLTKLPFLVLSRVKSMATINTDLSGVLDNLFATEAMGDYLIQCLVTDGTTTYAILPPTSDNQSFVIQNITANPKLTNFRWVNSTTVVRADLQTRPTGVERWNAMPCPLAELRFTKAYESNTRLSEFIGIDGTTKSSTDAELEAIYTSARAIFLNRARDGQTWQTMHSVVYGNGMEELWVQENWEDAIFTAKGIVRYDEQQNLTMQEQAQARENINAQDRKVVVLTYGGGEITNWLVTADGELPLDREYTARQVYAMAYNPTVRFVLRPVGAGHEDIEILRRLPSTKGADLINLYAIHISTTSQSVLHLMLVPSVVGSFINDYPFKYANLSDKPKINNVELSGDKTAAQLGLASAEDVGAIEGKIPAQASADNQLADKGFVNSSLNALAAFYITSNAAGDAFATKAALIAGPYYNGGQLRTPTKNDYAIVLADESKGGATTRYSYDGTVWAFQYKVNDTPLTAAQLAALNSGITSGLVGKLGDLPTAAELTAALAGKQSTLTSEQLENIADVPNKENADNKVDIITYSPSTILYPSCKAVVDYVSRTRAVSVSEFIDMMDLLYLRWGEKEPEDDINIGNNHHKQGRALPSSFDLYGKNLKIWELTEILCTLYLKLRGVKSFSINSSNVETLSFYTPYEQSGKFGIFSAMDITPHIYRSPDLMTYEDGHAFASLDDPESYVATDYNKAAYFWRDILDNAVCRVLNYAYKNGKLPNYVSYSNYESERMIYYNGYLSLQRLTLGLISAFVNMVQSNQYHLEGEDWGEVPAVGYLL